jgi:hypothetical protein
MSSISRSNLTRDLFLPIILFTALGGMTWAIRGCSGFGASAGCIFAGVMWGAAWWYLAYDPRGEQTRRYSSAWIVLAVTLAFGFSGARGWMQWPSFFEGRLDTNVQQGESVPISQTYGFIWLFIAGAPWAGLGACALAWCGSLRETRAWHWFLRMACGVGAAYLARYLFDTYPASFLPLYSELESRYKDLESNPNLGRLINDSGLAITHLGYYLGFLLFELLRREWKNVVLIITVGLLNGCGWAAFQNWKWARRVWPDASFNFWRCWESSGGLSIGFAFGIAYFLVNRPMSSRERELVARRTSSAGPNFEWLLVFCGLTAFIAPYFRGWTASRGLQNDAMSYYLPVLYCFAAIYYWMNHRGPDGTNDSEITGFVGLLIPLAFLVGGELPWPRRAPVRYDLLYTAGVYLVGLAWWYTNRQEFEAEKTASTPHSGDPVLERLGLYLGLLAGLGLSIRNGAKGWFNIYQQKQTACPLSQFLWQWFGPTQPVRNMEVYWGSWLWRWLGPTYLVILLVIVFWALLRSRRPSSPGPLFPHSYAALWLVLIVQNVIAQLVTGPLDQWNEVAFSIYYVALFLITAVIVAYYRLLKSTEAALAQAEGVP